MRILVAEDDDISRRVLEVLLRKNGYEVTLTRNGEEAWKVLESEDAPNLAILDWMMPEKEGVEICRLARSHEKSKGAYIILLTARSAKEDIILGLESGADDYLTKPINPDELFARLNVGKRILDMQKGLTKRIRELEEARTQIKSLQGLLPICSYCKKIRNDENYWVQLESYLTKNTEAMFSHSICPECYEKYAKSSIRDYMKTKRQK